jgi:hypothetical protein
MSTCLLGDLCFWVYIGIAIISLYGFCLFFWWWRLGGHASEVYIYVMLLMLSNFLYYSINSYARFIFVTDINNTNAYEDIINSLFWNVRAIPNLIIISLIVIRMSIRARHTVSAMKRVAKESEDRRKCLRREEDRKIV